MYNFKKGNVSFIYNGNLTVNLFDSFGNNFRVFSLMNKFESYQDFENSCINHLAVDIIFGQLLYDLDLENILNNDMLHKILNTLECKIGNRESNILSDYCYIDSNENDEIIKVFDTNGNSFDLSYNISRFGEITG